MWPQSKLASVLLSLSLVTAACGANDTPGIVALVEPDTQPSEQSSPTGNLVWSDDLGTKMWADSITVIDGTEEYVLPLATQGIGDSDKSVELQWVTDGGVEIELSFYLTVEESNWWVYEIRSWIQGPDEDTDRTYYPGDYLSNTPAGRYMVTSLGTSYEGSLDLDTIRIEGLRVEALTAEHPVDRANDLGSRPARDESNEPYRALRLQTEHTLLDVDNISYDLVDPAVVSDFTIVTGTGTLEESGDGSEIEVIFTNEDMTAGLSQMLIYFRTDGIDWWIYRAWLGVDGERIVNAEGLELARTPLGGVFEGDLEIDGLKLTNVRLEHSNCSNDQRGERESKSCYTE